MTMGGPTGSEPSGGHRRGRRSYDGFTEINVTPMVDVMLVLLIIFMVTAPMLTAGVTVDLPDSSATPLPGQDEPVVVSIDKAGNVYIGETRTTAAELEPKLKAVTHEKTDTRIFVRGDRSVDYGKVMEVMGRINAGGFTKVALLTNAVPEGKR